MKIQNGAFKSIQDNRDFEFVGSASTPFDWNKGFNIEEELNFKIPVKSQGDSKSCFPGKTKVLMEDFSYKNISAIKTGDIVFTHNGVIRKVIKTFKRKWQGTTKILSIYGDYKKVECTKEHPFYAIKRPDGNPIKRGFIRTEDFLKNQNPKFYKISELKRGDWIVFPFNNTEKDTTIYSFEKDPDFLWLLGLYIAEGSSVNGHGVALSLHKKEKDKFERTKKIMERFGANVTCCDNNNGNGMCVYIWGTRWVDIFEELGGKYCDKKRINKRLMFISPELQMNIYDGVQDGDGTTHRGAKVIKSTSQILLEQLRVILLRNKIYSSLCKEKYYDGKKQAYTLSVSAKSRYSYVSEKYCFVQIKSIEHNKAFMGENVYNLEVDVDNSYQVNGMAVHNCGGQAFSYYTQVLEALYSKTFEERSAKFLYSQVALPEGGSRGRDICKIIYNQGSAREAFLPSYKDGKPLSEEEMVDTSNINDVVRQDAKSAQSISYENIKQISIDNVAIALRDNKGVVIGVSGENNGTWLTAFPTPPKTAEWGHWLFVGKAKLINGKKYIGVLNSWGDKVGEGGWQWLGEDYFNTIASGYIAIWEAWTLSLRKVDEKRNLLLTLLTALLNAFKK